MPIPAASTTSLTATGYATHTKNNIDNFTMFAVSGTYTGLSFTFEGTIDGTNWFAVDAFRRDTVAQVTSTISPTDGTTVDWRINSEGLTGVRANVSAITGGTATFSSRSHQSVAPPVVIVNTSGTSMTGNLAVAGTITGTSTSASALAVGANGATNPVLKVDASTASVATGVSITGAAAAARVAIAAISSGTNEGMDINAKGSGTIRIGNSSTGAVLIGSGTNGPHVLTGTLTAGGLLTCALQVATSGPLIYSGSGAPTISAAVKGSLYLRTDGSSTSTRAYVATDTAGTWTAITTAA